MLEIRRTRDFAKWLRGLSDVRARARIQIRMDRLAEGNTGDAKSVGGGVHEMRVDYGPGYRVYFARRAQTVVLLLWGGDKRTQREDIVKAKALAKEWNDGA